MEGERDMHDASPSYDLRMHSLIHCPPGRWARSMHHLRDAGKTDAGPASLSIIHCDFQRSNFSLTVVAVPLH